MDFTLKKTEELAKKTSKMLSGGDIIALSGNLGAGKSTLAKMIIENFELKYIGSPTFSKIITYKIKCNNRNNDNQNIVKEMSYNNKMSNNNFKIDNTANNALNDLKMNNTIENIFHCDLYQMQNFNQLDEYIYELDNSILILEWADLYPNLHILDNVLKIQINNTKENHREINISGHEKFQNIFTK